jgi:hypothetical protein
MKLRFVDILNEQDNTKREKYLNWLFPKLVDYFENRYSETDAIQAASFMDQHDVNEYRKHLQIAKELGDIVKGNIEKIRNLENLEPKDLQDFISTDFRDNLDKYKNELHYLGHIRSLFIPFTEIYNVPIGIMLDLWEKYYEEVYKPNTIEKNRTSGGRDLFYGLDGYELGNDIEIIRAYQSYNSSNNDYYVLMKDNEQGDYILGFNIGWKWDESGIDLSKLYYLPFKTEKEAVNYMLSDTEKMYYNDFDHEHRHGLIGVTSEKAKRLHDYTIANLSDIYDSMRDEEIPLENAISNFLYYEDVDPNLIRDDLSSFARRFIKFKDTIDQIS